MNTDKLSNDNDTNNGILGDVNTRTSCIKCKHCKVMDVNLYSDRSFLCFKGKYGLTTNQKVLSMYLDCQLFEDEF
jgi:hypothetical protein